MTLEVLFAQASQCRTFLLMVLCGAALALSVQLAGSLHRVNRYLGLAADVLCALLLAVAAGWILLGCGEGLRLYGLLGGCIGCAAYAAGIRPVVNWLGRITTKKRTNTNW